MNLKESLRLYFIMGSPNCESSHPAEILEEAISGGVTFFQFREKGTNALTGSSKKQLAQQLKEICHKNNVPFIVNDDVDLAIEIDADGVHIGQEDEDLDFAREKMKNKLLGVSAHNLEEAKIAIQKGADYLGVGPMYETKTKLDVRDIQGPRIIKEMRKAGILIPIVGIGGISSNNASEIMNAGADGIAVISSISGSISPQKAAKELKSLV
jgi:thiamine-phosphate pyrophosphorylase